MHLPDSRLGLVGKIHGDDPSHGAGELVHESAGLAEVDVLRVLAHLGHLDGGEGPAAEEVVGDGAHEHLEGGGGAQAAAPEDPGGGIGVKAGDGIPQLLHPGRDAPDQGHGVPHLLLVDGQVVQVHLRDAVVAGLDPDDPAFVGDHAGDGVQVHAGAQAVAPLMVGVIPAQLRAPRRGEEQRPGVLPAGEDLPVFPHQLRQPGRRRRGARAVDRFQL